MFCLHCGQQIQREESCRGTQINCPSCSHSFLVPHGTNVPEGGQNQPNKAPDSGVPVMAEFKFNCPKCGQHIQCDGSYSGRQINCPQCQTACVVPQLMPPKPKLSVTVKPEKMYLVNSDGNQCGPYTIEKLKAYLESGELAWGDLAWCEGMCQWQPLNGIIVRTGFSQTPPTIRRQANQSTSAANGGELNQLAAVCMVFGVICYGFGLVDFFGMFFDYDITGIRYSPTLAWFIGSGLIALSKKNDDTNILFSSSATYAAVAFVGLLSFGSVYFLSTTGWTPILILEERAKTAIQAELLKKSKLAKVTHIQLSHREGNHYAGVITIVDGTAQVSGDWTVDVTNTATELSWHIKPQSSADKIATTSWSPSTEVDSRLSTKAVSNGYLKVFGNEVTIGEVFNVVSEGTAQWSADRLASSEPEYLTHYLVESTWYNEKSQLVKCQFNVELSGSRFYMYGAFIGGKSMEFTDFQEGIKAIWVKKGGTLK